MSKPSDGTHENLGNLESLESDLSQDSQTSQASQPPLLPPRGDYKTLLSYQKSEVIYQIPYRFCKKFLEKGDRKGMKN